MYDNALEALKQRREELRDAIARSIHEADNPTHRWYATTDSTREHCRELADAALETVDRHDDGLIDWLGDAEGETRERMSGAAADLRALVETETALPDSVVERLVAIAAQLTGPHPLPRRERQTRRTSAMISKMNTTIKIR